jgi:hypothetical protein
MNADAIGKAFAIVCVGIVAGAVSALAPYAAVAVVAYQLGRDKGDGED